MYPRRGAFALLVTALALVALLNYRTPELSPPSDSLAYVAPPAMEPSLVALVDGSTELPGTAAAGASPAGSSTSMPSSVAGTEAPSQSETALASGSGQPPSPGTTATPAPIQKPTASPRTTAAPTPKPTVAPTPPPAGRTGTSTGSVASTPYGSVQVRVTYGNGKITDVVALKYPNGDSHSLSLAQHALPILRSEALAAQSAKIDTVSGATYTSNGYKTSLQWAIDHP